MISPAAVTLIQQWEGIDQPGSWPGGDSGVTIGYGFDLGYELEADFDRIWAPLLDPDTALSLRRAMGLRGSLAAQRARLLRDIRITPEQASAAFGPSLERYELETASLYPGFDKLPADAAGALVSLIYNRGTSLSGPRRTEMAGMVVAVGNCDLRRIADLLRSMKRLWPNSPGLQNRREAEAQLVESCI